jgi:hypothetical protein
VLINLISLLLCKTIFGCGKKDNKIETRLSVEDIVVN